MKKLIALLLALVMVLGLAACSKPAGQEGKGTIAVVAKGETHAFWQAVKAGAVDAGTSQLKQCGEQIRSQKEKSA